MPSQPKKRKKLKGYKIKTPWRSWDIKNNVKQISRLERERGVVLLSVAEWQSGGCGLSRPQLVERISDAWKTNKKGIKSHLSQSAERRQSQERNRNRNQNRIASPNPEAVTKPETSTTSSWLGTGISGRTRTTATRVWRQGCVFYARELITQSLLERESGAQMRVKCSSA